MGSNTSFIEQRIGNPFFSTNSKEDSQTSHLLSEFNYVSSYEDSLFKKCSIIEHKQTNELIVVKQVNCENQQQMHKLSNQFQKRRETFVHENTIRLRYVLKKKVDGIFSDQFKIILFFDYILTNLEQELKNRQIKKLQFSAEQINSILCGAVKGYASLQQHGLINDKVRIKNLYFGLNQKDPIIKVIDSKLFPTPNNIDSVRERNNYDDIFLAPQQLKTLQLSKFQTTNQKGSNKSGVFSLGMTLMQLCLYFHSRQIYDYQKCSMNYQQLEIRLNVIKNKYSLSVYYIIREMLQRNEDSRPSFIKLRDNLPTNIKSLSQRMSLSVINQTNTKHVNMQNKMTKILPPIGYSKLPPPQAINPSQRKMQSTALVSQYRPNVNSSEIYTNGNMFMGQKKDNLRHGKGKYVYSDGSHYYGDWFKGKMEGFGQLYNTNGQLQYEGQWKDDHYNGRGKLISHGIQNWTKYDGQFINGKMQGFGQLFYKNGEKYKGQFRADYPWGKGRLFKSNGIVQIGIFERGQFLEEA